MICVMRSRFALEEQVCIKAKNDSRDAPNPQLDIHVIGGDPLHSQRDNFTADASGKTCHHHGDNMQNSGKLRN